MYIKIFDWIWNNKEICFLSHPLTRVIEALDFKFYLTNYKKKCSEKAAVTVRQNTLKMVKGEVWGE